jgi:hypothetical protein
LLSATEYAYNSNRNVIIGKIPFEMVYNYIFIMQLNSPSERDAGITNVFSARYTVEEHAKAVKEHKK